MRELALHFAAIGILSDNLNTQYKIRIKPAFILILSKDFFIFHFATSKISIIINIFICIYLHSICLSGSTRSGLDIFIRFYNEICLSGFTRSGWHIFAFNFVKNLFVRFYKIWSKVLNFSADTFTRTNQGLKLSFMFINKLRKSELKLKIINKLIKKNTVKWRSDTWVKDVAIKSNKKRHLRWM